MILEPTRLEGLEPGEPVNFQQVLIRPVILLMLQKSGDHLLRLVVYPIIYNVLYIYIHTHPRWLFGISEPSTVCGDIMIFSKVILVDLMFPYKVDFLATLSDVCQRKSRAFKIQMIAK